MWKVLTNNVLFRGASEKAVRKHQLCCLIWRIYGFLCLYTQSRQYWCRASNTLFFSFPEMYSCIVWKALKHNGDIHVGKLIWMNAVWKTKMIIKSHFVREGGKSGTWTYDLNISNTEVNFLFFFNLKRLHSKCRSTVTDHDTQLKSHYHIWRKKVPISKVNNTENIQKLSTWSWKCIWIL